MKLDTRLTNSEISCGAMCLRKMQLTYVAGLRPLDDAVPLRFGKAWHAALERRANGTDLEQNVMNIRVTYNTAFEHELDEARRNVLAYEAETLVAMLRVYDWRWSDMDKEIVTIATEESFEVPIVNPATGAAAKIFTFAGRVDRRVKLADGRMALVECKTTSMDIAPDANYWLRLRVDDQLARYVLAMRHLKRPIDCVLWDAVRKPTIKPGNVPLVDDDGIKIVLDKDGQRVRTKDGKKWRTTGDTEAGYVAQVRPETPKEWGDRVQAALGEEPDRWFRRQEIPCTDDDLAEAMANLWNSAQILHACDLNNRWPRNGGACIGFGVCRFLPLCSMNWKPTDGSIPPGFMKVDDVHQELTDAT